MRLDATGKDALRGQALAALLLAPAKGFGQTLVVVRDDGGALVGGPVSFHPC